jgi:hypothetical protein
MIKKILIAIVALIILGIAVVAVAAYVTPTECTVEREITINRPKAAVFDYVKFLKHQNTWGPWAKKDPAMKQEFRGNDGYAGFVLAWKSENGEVGSGEQEIKKIVEGERIDTELRFNEPFETKSDAYMVTEATGPETTRMKWGFTATLPRPVNVMMLVVDMDAMMGKDFEEGLSNLKLILETPPTVN